MGIKLLIRDRNSRPISNISVFVKWKDGTSSTQSDGAGVADTGVSSGYIKYVEVKGEKIDVEAQLRDGDSYPVQLRSS